jgi:hypothetical protein
MWPAALALVDKALKSHDIMRFTAIVSRASKAPQPCWIICKTMI